MAGRVGERWAVVGSNMSTLEEKRSLDDTGGQRLAMEAASEHMDSSWLRSSGCRGSISELCGRGGDGSLVGVRRWVVAGWRWAVGRWWDGVEIAEGSGEEDEVEKGRFGVESDTFWG